MVDIPLEFVGDAICLSGLTGTKLKCEVIGDYYSFWWGITSGGQRIGYRYPTSIVELNAATGENYIEATNETILGSSGHALNLKVTKAPQTANLKVVLVEENLACYGHLKNVISRRWPSICLDEAEGSPSSNSLKVFLLNKTLEETLEIIEPLSMGNTLFFFDPLRSVNYSAIESVASRRMRRFLQTGTEFIIFVDGVKVLEAKDYLHDSGAVGFRTWGDIMQTGQLTVQSLGWSRTYSGTCANSVVQTTDGGYALAGYTTASVYDTSESDFWLVKVDSAGNQQWRF